jgi:RimJ/RimL family protein N-acetyltransferase
MGSADRQTVLLSDGVIGLRRPEALDAPHYLRMRNDLTLVSSVMGFRLGVSEQTIGEWIAQGGVTGDDLLFTAVLIAENHRPIGYLKMFRVDRYSRHAWLGLSLFAEADAGRGVGRRMLTQGCDYLRDFLAIRKVSLEVLAGNARALSLYASLGFAEEGRMRSQFYTDGRFDDVVILSKFLTEASAVS